MNPVRRSSHCFLLACALFAGAVRAQDITLEQAVERVQKDTDGRVLAAEEIDVGKRKVYRIKVLTREGSVRRVLVSADGKDGEPRSDKPAGSKTDKNGKGR
jgi:hypothetical protein